MRIAKTLAATFGLAAGCLLLGTTASAQSTSPVGFLAAGSSAMWNTFGITARVDNASGGTSDQGNCFSGTPGAADTFHVWTGKKTTGGADKRATIHDSRVAGDGSTVPDVQGNIWIVWDDTAHPNKNICAYVNVDSGVGNRALFAVPQAVVQLPAADSGAAGDQVIPQNLMNGHADEALPADIFNSVNGQPVNVAMSDIRPEDAFYAHLRVVCASGSSGTCLYNPTVGGGQIQTTPYKSDFSTAALGAATFQLTGGGVNSDPISGQIVPGVLFRFATNDIGAAPILVSVNISNAAAGHLGDANLTNINTATLASFLDGTLHRGEDLFSNYAPGTIAPTVPVTTWLREALSGTYNTMEFDVVRSRRVTSTQENGNIPSPTGCVTHPLFPPHNTNPCPAAISNPLHISYAGGGLRRRAVGTGDMISAIAATPDSLGYAFWGFGNYNGVSASIRYLTVDGVEPLASSYSVNGGVPPQCPAPVAPNFCKGLLNGGVANPPFPHVADGSYPIWGQLQMVTITSPSAPATLAAPLLAGSSSAAINKLPDYIPVSQLNIFRDHYNQSFAGISGRNNHCSGALTGGQMGGSVFNIQADNDSCADNGTELLEYRQ